MLKGSLSDGDNSLQEEVDQRGTNSSKKTKGVNKRKLNRKNRQQDGCTYQNRNKCLANALYDFCCKTNKTVFQKILEKGHTQMECDNVHAACERALRDKKIYVPSNYKTYIEEARPKQPYEVQYLTHDFFNTYNNLTYFASIRPGHKVGDPVVTDIRQFKYTVGSLEYKLDYIESEFLPLPHRCKENTGGIRRKYAEKTKIKKSKYDDLQALKNCHAFYNGL
ncbi:hypothetical protein WMY93_027145 [Mugilogobius chulae]|uniref:Uncharacterized protein n=1 Tax=Mugilogobius chulae TaxID=88201 RepID=A0AAW0N3Y9_9GOBI